MLDDAPVVGGDLLLPPIMACLPLGYDGYDHQAFIDPGLCFFSVKQFMSVKGLLMNSEGIMH